MEALAVENLSFAYPGRAAAALENVSFSLERGSFTVLTGLSGCGKTTLLRQFRSALAPHGTRTGAVRVLGQPLDTLDRRAQSTAVGFVRQNPDEQIVTDKVYHELAFGLESLGFSTPEIRARVAEMAAFFGISDWFYRDTAHLSGGQKQLLNLASVMAMGPEVLLLDEPTSQLDPIAAADFLATVSRIHRELGTTVLMTGHRLDEALPLCDRVLVMDGGRLLLDGAPREIGPALLAQKHALFDAMPVPMRVSLASGGGDPCPVTVQEGRAWLEAFAREHPLHPVPERVADAPGAVAAELREVWFRYGKDSPDVLRGLSLRLHRGELLAILGGNGAGKSTALGLLSGARAPWRGTVRAEGRVAALPQDPRTLFLRKTVREELDASLPAGCADTQARLARAVALCRLAPLLERHPYDLSGGEMQRAALAMLLLQSPDILLLDEPTKGLDARFKRELAATLRTLARAGCAIALVSHDVEFCAAFCDRCVLLFDGAAAAGGTPREFFSGKLFYTTAASRISRGLVSGAVTADELIAACGGTPPAAPPDDAPDEPPAPPPPSPGSPGDARLFEKKRLPRRTVFSALCSLLLIPLIIVLGTRFFGDRKYYLISLLVLLACMAPFFLVLEGRRPRARELVLLAVLCALGVAGRAALAMLPQCKPVIALAVITGAAFGGEAGFLVGAVTMLTSNVIFGQGPWTPWQMFAVGLIGFLAGILTQTGLLRRSRAALSIFGALSALVIFGGIMNPASALIAQQTLSWPVVAAYCLSGLPMDLVQAASTAVFLWFLALPMLEKLDRVKVKYGLLAAKA